MADAEAKIVKAAAIVAAPPEASMPELPPHLKRCLQSAKQQTRSQQQAKQAKKGKADKKAAKVADDTATKDVQPKSPSADALALKQLEDRKMVAACADAVLKWNDGLKKQKVAPTPKK